VTDLGYLFGLEYFGIKLGLENITAIVERLGHPEEAFRSVHVAGTNGKGSVTAMLDAILRAAGSRCGRYTSPHLVHLHERFVIDGHPVGDLEMGRALEDVRAAVDRARAEGAIEVQPTFFEVTTAMAFELFRRAGLDLAVVEVGLGGRLDATNIINPLASTIVSVDLEHQQHLGGTLRDIAAEKAGIIKRDTPVVLGEMAREARAEMEHAARERRAPVVHAMEGADAAPLGPATGTASGQRIRLRTPAHDYGELTLSLLGDHQVANAVVAVRTIEVLRDRGLTVPVEAVAEGLARTWWPGRLDERRLADGRSVLLDAAHNPSGAAALAAYLRERPGGPLPLVLSVMRDKDVRAMLAALVPAVGGLVITRASNRRAADPEQLASIARSISSTLRVEVVEDPGDALAAAWRLAPAIAVAGSLFLLGDVLPRLS
jgi:dihydrofolate synthase / folylpolyglutamate synthase